MKHQSNRKSGFMLLGFGLIMAAFTITIVLVLIGVTKKMGNPSFLPMLFPAIGGGLVIAIFVSLGVSMIVKGNKSRAIKNNGRKTKCEVYNVLRVKNGYQLIVTFRGDSGTEYKHGLYIDYQNAALLRPGLWIECYVQGEECYVDDSHIVIKDNDDFE